MKVDLLSGLAIRYQFQGPGFGPKIECRFNKIQGKSHSIRSGVRISLKIRSAMCTVVVQRLTLQRLTHFTEFLEILKK